MTDEKPIVLDIPDNVIPKDFIHVKAPDGCEYWVAPKAFGNPDYFFPCYQTEDYDTDESWHSGDELQKIKEIDKR